MVFANTLCKTAQWQDTVKENADCCSEQDGVKHVFVRSDLIVPLPDRKPKAA